MRTLMWERGASEEENTPPPPPVCLLQLAWPAYPILLLQVS